MVDLDIVSIKVELKEMGCGVMDWIHLSDGRIQSCVLMNVTKKLQILPF
jgi:hypothetical protein